MGRFRSTLRCFIWSLVLTCLLRVPAAGAHGVEMSGGIHTSFGTEHRDDYGNASAFTFAYSTPLSPKDVHLILEAGYFSNSGNSYEGYVLAAAPGSAEEHYWFVPFTIGVRANLVPESYKGPIGFYYGFGILTLFTGLERGSSKDTATSLGGMMEFRPEFRISPSLSVWIRERISVVVDAEYNNGTLNYSGATLQLGLSLGQP